MLHSRRRFEQWLPAGYDGLFDWDFLKPAFAPTTIEPMDFDAVIERRGHVLIFETKRHGADVPRGQIITLTNEWRQRGASIFHVRGKTAQDITGLACYWEGAAKGREFGSIALQEANWLDVLFHTYRWFCYASGTRPVPREAWEQSIWVRDLDQAQCAIPGMVDEPVAPVEIVEPVAEPVVEPRMSPLQRDLFEGLP